MEGWADFQDDNSAVVDKALSEAKINARIQVVREPVFQRLVTLLLPSGIKVRALYVMCFVLYSPNQVRGILAV